MSMWLTVGSSATGERQTCGTASGGPRFAVMTDDKLYDEATEVTSRDGEVILDGPDGVHVKVTPEAAEQTADNLIQGAVKARGERRLMGFPHRPQ